MNYPAVAQVEAYWEGLRNGRAVPARSEIDPRGMNDALEYAFILERIAAGVARFRLAGMHLSDLMGMEVRGMPLTAMFTPESRVKISAAMEEVFEGPEIIQVSLRGERGMGRGALDAQLLLCPLKSDLGDVNRVLGCLQSRGDIGRQPRRFEVLEITRRPIIVDPNAPAVASPKKPMAGAALKPRAKMPLSSEKKPGYVPSGFAEAKRAFEAAGGFEGRKEKGKAEAENPSKKRPALRLVSDNDD
ncbi:MAG: PAS domain-containing protein [Paracoccaceae bacterium]